MDTIFVLMCSCYTAIYIIVKDFLARVTVILPPPSVYHPTNGNQTAPDLFNRNRIYDDRRVRSSGQHPRIAVFIALYLSLRLSWGLLPL
jgi:hypothetical protein